MPLPENKTMKQFARDIVEGNVFGTWRMSETDKSLISQIFMPLMFLEKDNKLPDDTLHLFEYLSEAGPRSINGYPIFMSFGYLSKAEADELDIAIEEYRNLVKDFD